MWQFSVPFYPPGNLTRSKLTWKCPSLQVG